MPLKGVSQVRGRYQAVIKDIAENKTRKVVTAIVFTGAAWAKKFTPVDVPFLINTQQKRVRPENGVMVGRVWYEAEYAIYLETNPDWKPRKKKTAKPHFLRSGFEDEGPQSEINEIIRNGYKL